MTDKTTHELEAQANAMIQTLSAQRNAAQDQVVNLIGQVAILEMRLAAKEAKGEDVGIKSSTEVENG